MNDTTGSIHLRWDGGEKDVSPGAEVILGRDPSCGVVLQAPSASRRHASLSHQNGRWVLHDLGSAQGMFVDRKKVPEQILDRETTVTLGSLSEGAHVTFVPYDDRTVIGMSSSNSAQFETVLPTGQRPGGDLRPDELGGATIVAGQMLTVSCGTETRTVQPGQTVVVGRDASADLISANPTVSRRHVLIRHDGTNWRLEDQGSNGGTFLDGRRVTTSELVGKMAFWLGEPDTGERLVTSTAGDRKLGPSQRLARASRGRGFVLASIAAALVVVTLIAGLLVARSGNDGGPDKQRLAKATVKVSVDRGTGSGTIIDAKRGLILTNAHVVAPDAPGQAVLYEDDTLLEPVDNIQVSIAPAQDRPANPRFLAKVVSVDGYLDLAVIQITKTLTGSLIDPSDLKGLVDVDLGDSDAVKSGDDLFVLGYPGVSDSDRATLTNGIVSGETGDERLATNRAFFNIDAKFEPGNSGGLAADSHGRIIGIPTLTKFRGKSLQNQMRPVNLAKPLLEAAQKQRAYKSPFVRELTGKERIKEMSGIEPRSSSGFSKSCATAVPADPAAGDKQVSLFFTYSGFAKSVHQDLLILVVNASDTVVGSATTADQYPFNWDGAGDACVTVLLADPLEEGEVYRVMVEAGPSYSKGLFNAKFSL